MRRCRRAFVDARCNRSVRRSRYSPDYTSTATLLTCYPPSDAKMSYIYDKCVGLVCAGDV